MADSVKLGVILYYKVKVALFVFIEYSKHGMVSLLSMVKISNDPPVTSVGIGSSGAKNASLLAGCILSTYDLEVRTKLEACEKKMTQRAKESITD